MKKLIPSAFALLLASCYFDTDLNNYGSAEAPALPMQEEYYWLHDTELFASVDSVQVVGQLENENNPADFYSINRKCPVSGDTLYVAKKSITRGHEILNARLYIADELHEVRAKLK